MANSSGWQPRQYGSDEQVIFVRDDLQPYPGGGIPVAAVQPMSNVQCPCTLIGLLLYESCLR